MSKDLSFACTACGLCCKTIGKVIENGKKIKNQTAFEQVFIDFPYEAREDGSCEKLDENGLCTVYENRPLVCNVEKMYETFWEKHETRDEHYLRQAKTCNRWIKEADYPEKFLVNESQYETS